MNSNIKPSSYRLGDLVLLELTDYNKSYLCNNNPNSIGYEYISSNISINKIENITKIVNKFIEKYNDLLPLDIEDSVVVHLRLGDVIVGDKYHEQLKRPYDVNDIKSTVLSIKEPYNKIYIIGKCYFDDVEFDVSKLDNGILLSNKYLNDVLNELNSEHFDGNHADIDLCCAVKAKIFIRGKGCYSELIYQIRNYLNKINYSP
jgi:hypothetical protein